MTKITIIEGACAIIKSDDAIELLHGEINTKIEGQIAICRCGKSNNPPYCDGSHKPKETETT